MEATFPGTPILSRLKSITRYLRLWPPPRRLIVMRPWLLRPPDLESGAMSDFSGVALVTSSKELTVLKRSVGVMGRNFLTGISSASP